MVQQAANVSIVLTEVSLVFGFFALLNWLIGQIFKQQMKIPWFRQGQKGTQRVRRKIQRILLLSGLMLCLLIVGANAWLLYQGENLSEYTLLLLRRTPADVWEQLGIAIAKTVMVLLLAGMILRPLRRMLHRACDRAKKFEQITANDQSIDAFFLLLETSLSCGIWLFAVALCTNFLGLPDIIVQPLYVLLKIYLIITIGLLIAKVKTVIIYSLDALSDKYVSADNWLRFYDQLRHLVPFLERCLEYAIYVCMATLVVEQVELIADLASYGPKIVKIIGIVLMSRIFIEVAKLVVEEVLLRNRTLTDVQRQRRLTIIPLMQSVLKYLIYFGAGISILYTVNINPTPILAAAGIVGLAASLGAQNLINDIVCGFFILFENYYLVGDYIETGSAEGYVEAIELRTTRIRDLDGQQYILRNGDVGQITNYSKQFIYAVVEVGVSYDSSLDQVSRVIEEVGKQLKQDNPDVLEATTVQGLDNFGESDLVVRTVTKVKPGRHTYIRRVLRKLIKEAFDREGIEIPFARRVLIFQNEDKS